jgi:hypothetical protein
MHRALWERLFFFMTRCTVAFTINYTTGGYQEHSRLGVIEAWMYASAVVN